MNHPHDQRVELIKARAHGHWTQLLASLGVDEKILNGKNQPCPMEGCGGHDRFAYTDKYGNGDWHCRKHSPKNSGGGLKLAMGVLRIPFPELLDRLEDRLGNVRALPKPASGGAPSAENMKKLCQRIWDEAKPVTAGDDVDRYLRNRGIHLDHFPRSLRCHPALGYYEKKLGEPRSKKVAEYPAMLACVQGADDHAVTLHRTYLKDGQKAKGSESKKVLSAGINGAAIRLGEASERLAVTEGIETGLAVLLKTGTPVWAAISCGNMEKLWIPDSVKELVIYGDNDANSEFDGQASAYALARRVRHEAHKKGRHLGVKVFVPKLDGMDWADVLFTRLMKEQKAA